MIMVGVHRDDIVPQLSEGVPNWRVGIVLHIQGIPKTTFTA